MTIRRSSVDLSMSNYKKMHGLANKLPGSRCRMRMLMIPQCESSDTSTSVSANSVPLRNSREGCGRPQVVCTSGSQLSDRYVRVVTRNTRIPKNSMLWRVLLAVWCTSLVVEAQELSQLFLSSYPSQSRFLNFAGKSQRDIVVRLTKNLTEDTPVGTLIATFRAEDKDSMTHNLT
uniref:Uncharacterized protein n=1 Tax=Setaria digitata TaxID=48799 RepID=A0A915Q6G5_9BILA